MRDVWLKIGETSGAKIYALITGMITLMLTARWLGPDGRGIIAAAMTWAMLFGTIGYLSLGQVALNRMAALKGDASLARFLGSLLAIAAVLTAVGWLVASLMYGFSGGEAFANVYPLALLLAFLLLPFFIWEQYGSYLLMVMDRLDIYNKAQIAGRTAGLVLTVLVLFLGFGIYGVLGAAVIAQGVIALAGIRFLVRKAATKVRPEIRTVRELVSGGLKLHLNAVGTFAFTSADILIISHYAGAAQTGHYQLAVQLIAVMLVLPQAASLAMYSHVAKEGPDGAWQIQRKVALQMTVLMTGFALLAAVLAPFVIPAVVGSEFGPSIGVFQILLFALLGMSLSTVMAPQWIGRGLFIQSSVLTLVIGVGNVIANLILVPTYGMYGAAWATIGTYALSAGVNLIMAFVWQSSSRKAEILRQQSGEALT